MPHETNQLISDLRARGITLPEGPIRLGSFGDSEHLSAALIELIATGRKRGTSSLAWAWEADGETRPEPGEVQIVLDWHARPALVIRITEVESVPFDRVDAAFAHSEGEGDGSLDCWRTEHWRFFCAECARIGRRPDGSMPVVCERFEVLHTVLTPPDGCP